VAAQVLQSLGADLPRRAPAGDPAPVGLPGQGVRGRRSAGLAVFGRPDRLAGPRPVSVATLTAGWPGTTSWTRSSDVRRSDRAGHARSCPAGDENNPVLIGEPGRLGKTAIVEGLAQRIVRTDDVPETLTASSSTPSTSGHWWRAAGTCGDFESALKKVLKEDPHTRRHRPVIDELHTLGGRPVAAERCHRCRLDPQSPCWPAASCRPSVPPRSTSTASTSRRTRRSSDDSSRSRVEQPQRGPHHRDPEAACATGTSRTTTRSPSPTRHSVAVGQPGRPLPGPTGDLPDKAIDLIDVGRQPPAHPPP